MAAVGGGGLGFSMPEVHGHDDDEDPDLEPFFFDEAEAVADHERRVRREQEEACKEEERLLAASARQAVRSKILDFDPKQGGQYYNRFYLADFSIFDIDEESPLDPMRYTDTVYNKGDGYLCSTAVNILSVEVVSLDVCFPIHVCGTVIARDSLDCKCVYLFRREKDQCQVINSKEDSSLILAGPKRGLLLLDDAYVEIDLKIKGPQGQETELSKGFATISGIANRLLDKCEIESTLLDTRLSTMKVTYALMKKAVEATISIEVLEGEFHGKINACTTSINDTLVLHDSKVADVINSSGEGAVQLLRPVVSVCLEEELLVTIVAQVGDVEYKEIITFTPGIYGRRKVETTVGVTKMLVKVAWSLLMHRYL